MSGKAKTGRKKTAGCWIVGVLAFIACAVIALGYFTNRHRTALRSLTVYVDGREYLSSPLKPGETIVISQENGAENVIRMTADGFFMESASCPNQDCVKQGEVTVENWRGRKLLEQVICLPNRVSVSLNLTESADAQAVNDYDLPDV